MQNLLILLSHLMLFIPLVVVGIVLGSSYFLTALGFSFLGALSFAIYENVR